MTVDNRQGHQQPSGDPTKSVNDLMYPNNTGEKWTDEWEYLTIGAKSSTSYGTGISLTYRYKSNFSGASTATTTIPARNSRPSMIPST